jgi:HEAT repeat protein
MRRDKTGKPIDLTPRQIATLPYIVASPSLSDGARLADVGRSTLYRWLRDAAFAEELERQRARASDLARVELQGLMLKSILVLAEALEDPSPAIRLRAARSTLYVGLKTFDLKEVRQRLDQLDDTIDFLSSRSKNPCLPA